MSTKKTQPKTAAGNKAAEAAAAPVETTVPTNVAEAAAAQIPEPAVDAETAPVVDTAEVPGDALAVEESVEPVKAEQETVAENPAPEQEPEDDEPEVKSGFEKISIRAICDNGTPFCGSFRTLNFDADGVTEVTAADRDSLESLKAHFPTLEIKQA